MNIQNNSHICGVVVILIAMFITDGCTTIKMKAEREVINTEDRVVMMENVEAMDEDNQFSDLFNKARERLALCHVPRGAHRLEKGQE